jgi:hypothetical protein
MPTPHALRQVKPTTTEGVPFLVRSAYLFHLFGKAYAGTRIGGQIDAWQTAGARELRHGLEEIIFLGAE